MKKLLSIFSSLTAVFLGSFFLAQAAQVFYGNQIGNSATSGYVLQSTGPNSTSNWVATSTLGISASGGSGTISTSSPLVSGQSVYATGVNTIASAANLLWNNATSLLSISGNASSTQLTTTGSTYLATTGGNVGIGTTSPSALLAVQGNSYVSGTSFFGGAITATSTLAVTGTGNSYILGNVGIGTTTPTGHELLIDSNLGSAGQSALKIVYSGGSSILGEVAALANRNSQWNGLYVNGIGSSLTNAVYVEGTKPVIFNAGNVGIGNTSPQYPLDVTGTINSASSSNAANVIAFWGVNSGIGGGGQAATLRLSSKSGYSVDIRGVTRPGTVFNGFQNTELQFWTLDTGTVGDANLQQRMVIQSGGNVGIGTTVPKSKLDVNGGISVGSYAGVNAAPSNGMIISGNVGIGTTSPGTLLSIGNTGGINFSLATSTFNSTGGINLASGCFAIGGVCVGGGGGSGTVTSVAATVPSFLSISGSPITTSGTLAITLSGTALPLLNGGTGLTAVGASSTVMTTNGTVMQWNKLATSQLTNDSGFSALSLAAGTYTNGDMCTYASSGTLLNCNTAVPTGTVTAVSVASANGFSGTSSGGATPALTLNTSLGTPAGTFLAADPNGHLIATTTPAGAVSSVSNSDGTLTISPTTGSVVASLALAHANTWTGLQQFNGNASSTMFSATRNGLYSTTISGIELLNLTTATSSATAEVSPALTLTGTIYASTPGISTPVSANIYMTPSYTGAGSTGATINFDNVFHFFENGSGPNSFSMASYLGGSYTFADNNTASNYTFTLPNATGTLCLTTTCTGTVTSVGLSSSGSLTIGSSPITTSGTLTANLNLANANSFTGLQSFANASSTQFSAGTNTFYVDSTGHITAKDTVSGYSGVLSPLRNPSFMYATTTVYTATSSTNAMQSVAPYAGTLHDVRCHTDAGTLNVDIAIGSTHLALLNASTTVGTFSFTSNNTFTAGQVFTVVAGTPASSPTVIACTGDVTITP